MLSFVFFCLQPPTGIITVLTRMCFFTDWGPLVDVVGFCFLNLALNYRPPEALEKWLNAGPPPIYIGFGSLVSSLSQ
jgi:hypothetical protein